MAKLTTKTRDAIPSKDFALGGRPYPIEDKSHARNALARVSQHGSAEEKAEVRHKVSTKYPGIGESGRTGKYTHGAKKMAARKKG